MMTATGAIAMIYALVNWIFLGGNNMVPVAGCFLISCIIADAGASALYHGLGRFFNLEEKEK